MVRLCHFRAVAIVVSAAALELAVWGGDCGLRGGGAVPFWVVPAVAIPTFGALLLRWRYPVLVCALEWIFALTGLLLPGYKPFAGLLVALHAVARRASTRIAGLALSALMVPFGINSYNTGLESGHPVAGTLVTANLWVVVSLTVWGFGWHSRLAEEQDCRLLVRREAEALHAERLQFDRELHDIVANAVITALATLPAPRNKTSNLTDRLTPREREIMILMAHGMSNADITEHLTLSIATVKTHVARVVMKTGSRDRTQAVVLAYQSGLVTPSSPPPNPDDTE